MFLVIVAGCHPYVTFVPTLRRQGGTRLKLGYRGRAGSTTHAECAKTTNNTRIFISHDIPLLALASHFFLIASNSALVCVWARSISTFSLVPSPGGGEALAQTSEGDQGIKSIRRSDPAHKKIHDPYWNLFIYIYIYTHTNTRGI